MKSLPKASFKTTKKIWLNGRMTDWRNANVHVLSHALHYGSGVFEGIRFYKTKNGPAIFRLREHVARLIYSAKVLEMKIPFSKTEIENAIIKTVAANKIPAGYIRPLAFFDYGKMGLNPVGAPVSLAIACWPWDSYLGGKPIRVKTSRFIRLHPDSVVGDAKVCGHYVNSILASLEIKRAKYDEALFLDHRGFVAEGPGENIFFLKKGVLHTPKLGSILAGITRLSVIAIAKDLGVKTREGNYRLKDFYSADEVFFTGTAAEVQPIGSLDDKKINGGKAGEFTQKLREMFLAAVAGENPKYKKWLTFVK
ncbi:MAG: branched-chain amino acid transaminase [Candidatus Peribacteraceae bacterium]|nr:branched-chain amino acid transaminase [Candidatus Peribacteraceae bacterium]